jgi:predicted ATPase
MGKRPPAAPGNHMPPELAELRRLAVLVAGVVADDGRLDTKTTETVIARVQHELAGSQLSIALVALLALVADTIDQLEQGTPAWTTPPRPH